MFQFLSALNPWNTCFTSIDFDDTLIDIKLILNLINSPLPEEEKKALSPKEKKQLLENAFQLARMCLNAADKPKPDKQLSFLIADILRQYATMCYDENYFAAKQLLLAALNFHLYTIGIFNECLEIRDFISLDDLKKQGEAKPLLFQAFEDLVPSTSADRCMTLAYKDSFVHPQARNKLFSLAETVRWLGYCYQNITKNCVVNPENEQRFAQLFGLSEALFLLINDEESLNCLSDLYLKAWPYMHLRKNPEDLLGTCQIYDKALAYNHSTSMQAHVACERFQTLFRNGQKQEAFLYIQKALLLSESLEDHPDLVQHVYHQFAAYLMDPDSLNLEQAETYLMKASKHAQESRAMGNDRQPFALLDLQLAELKFLLGEFGAAKEAIERSITTLKKQPFSQEPYIIEAEALKSLISKALATTLQHLK